LCLHSICNPRGQSTNLAQTTNGFVSPSRLSHEPTPRDGFVRHFSLVQSASWLPIWQYRVCFARTWTRRPTPQKARPETAEKQRSSESRDVEPTIECDHAQGFHPEALWRRTRHPRNPRCSHSPDLLGIHAARTESGLIPLSSICRIDKKS